MAERVLGPKGPKRKRRLRLLWPLVLLCLVIGAIGAQSGVALDTTTNVPTFTFKSDEDCSKTPNCADDQPGQKDLSAHAVATPTPGDLWVAWKWDELSLSGGNTGDACALFDTDSAAPGLGKVDFAVCVTIGGNPATQLNTADNPSPRIYTCGDGKVDRCTSQYNLVPRPYGTACSVNQTGIDRTDPWHSGQLDTTAVCHIALADVGGATVSRLVNTCSYPSQQPTSDPSDCVLIPRDAFLKIVKNAGGDTTTNFAFTVSGGNTFSGNVKGSTQSVDNSVIVPIKSATATSVSETLPSSDWQFTSASCSGGTNNGSTSGTGVTGITAASDATVTCTFTNALKAPGVLTIDKVCSPGPHAATDRFQPKDGSANAGDQIACGGSTTYTPTPNVAFNITEAAGSTTPATSLSNYETPQYSSGCSGSLARGVNGTCTITNTLKAAPVLTIDKVCSPGPHAATDRFQPKDGSTNAGSQIACGGSTSYTATPDVAYNITEVAGSTTPATSLSNYETPQYSSGCAGTLSRGQTATCTITNTLKAAPVVTINKVCPAGPYAATDEFQPKDGSTNAGSQIACGGSTSYTATPDVAYNITEVAGTTTPATSLSNYGTPQYSTGCSGTLSRGQTATCTITNTLRTFTVITLVCEGSNLHASSVKFDGVTKTSLANAGLPGGLDPATVCGLGGARFTDKTTGTYTGGEVKIDP